MRLKNLIVCVSILIAAIGADAADFTVSPVLGVDNPGTGLTAKLRGSAVTRWLTAATQFDVTKIGGSAFSSAAALRMCEKSGTSCVQWGPDTAFAANASTVLVNNTSFIHTGTKTYYIQRVAGGVLDANFKSGEFVVTRYVPPADTTPPTVTVPAVGSPIGGVVSGTFSASDASTMPTVAVQLSRSGIFPTGSFATCQVSATPVSPTVSGGSGTYRFTASNVQCPGLTGVLNQVIYFRSYAQDASGYYAYSGSSFVLDPGNQPPALSSATATRNADGSVSASVYASDIDQNAFGIAAYITDSSGMAVSVSRKCQVSNCTNLGLPNGTYSFSWTGAEMATYAAGGGTFTVQFIGTDSENNSSTKLSNTFVVPAPFSVTGASPLTGQVNTVVPVTVTGTGFSSSIRVSLSNQSGANCASPSTWNATSATFSCTLDTVGTQTLSVRQAVPGLSVRDFTFSVTQIPPTTTVSGLSPQTARLDVPQVFTVAGTGLTTGMGFTVADCDSFSELAGGTATSRSYQCTPRLPGRKGVTIKTAPGGTVIDATRFVMIDHPARLGDSSARGNPSVGGVSLFNGNFFMQTVDLAVPGKGLSFALSRSYNSYDWQYETDHGGVPRNSPWRFNMEMKIGFVPNTGNLRLFVSREDGSGESYFLSGGVWYPIDLGNFSTIKVNADGSYTVQSRGQLSHTFDPPSGTGRLVRSNDRDGNQITYAYGGNGKVNQITDASGRIYTVAYDAQNRVSRVTDFTGRYVAYTYTDTINGRIGTFRDVRGGITTYNYNASGDIVSITDPRSNTALALTYTTVYGNKGVKSLTTAMGRATGGRSCNGSTVFYLLFYLHTTRGLCWVSHRGRWP
jgi:YD repeat-containing protein